MNAIERRLKQDILTNYRLRAWCARLGAWLNARAYRMLARSRATVRFMNHHVTNEKSDWFVHGIAALHHRVEEVLRRQREAYGSYYYFYGYPYQALGILGIYGERGTEERFEAYGLGELVGRDDSVLDIGCNCGFMALYTSFRTGCRAEGLDINPYMIEIGMLSTAYLRLSHLVKLHATRIQEFSATSPYSVVLSFATHWTDDENYRVPVREHFERCAGYLEQGGLLIFETHAADVGNPDFYTAIDGINDLFALQEKRDTDFGTRHLYLFRKR